MRFKDNTQTIPKDLNSRGLQVIATGQWRCATSSLQTAFEQLLNPPLAPSMHGAYVLPDPKKMKVICAAMGETDKARRQKLLHSLFDGYNASSDIPGFAFVGDLLEMYPDCKVILNKRASPQEWEKSVRSSLRFFSTWQYHLQAYWVPLSYWHFRGYASYIRTARKQFGVDDVFTVQCYERHNEWVREVAAAGGKEVLEWEPEDGWQPLCRFLDRPIPNVPFPRSNEGAEIEKLRFVFIRNGLWAWTKVLTTLTVVLVTATWLLA